LLAANLPLPEAHLPVALPTEPESEVVASAKRRSFTAEYKGRIPADDAAAQPDAIGALQMQKLRRENQHLSEQLRQAEIVIDVQNQWALLGWPLPATDPEEKPSCTPSPVWPLRPAPRPSNLRGETALRRQLRQARPPRYAGLHRRKRRWLSRTPLPPGRSCHPESPLQFIYLQEIATSIWRLERSRAAETELFAKASRPENGIATSTLDEVFQSFEGDSTFARIQTTPAATPATSSASTSATRAPSLFPIPPPPHQIRQTNPGSA
jgi:hypothetical protein